MVCGCADRSHMMVLFYLLGWVWLSGRLVSATPLVRGGVGGVSRRYRDVVAGSPARSLETGTFA